jgi:hypothetical protein
MLKVPLDIDNQKALKEIFKRDVSLLFDNLLIFITQIVDSELISSIASTKIRFSNSEIKSELDQISSHMKSIQNVLKKLDKQPNLISQLDFWYWKENNQSNQLYDKVNTVVRNNNLNKTDNIESIKKFESGYFIEIEELLNGIQSFRKQLETSKGANKKFDYCHLILELKDFFEQENWPYKPSNNKGSVFDQVVSLILERDTSYTLITNAFDRKHLLVKKY